METWEAHGVCVWEQQQNVPFCLQAGFPKPLPPKGQGRNQPCSRRAPDCSPAATPFLLLFFGGNLPVSRPKKLTILLCLAGTIPSTSWTTRTSASSGTGASTTSPLQRGSSSSITTPSCAFQRSTRWRPSQEPRGGRRGTTSATRQTATRLLVRPCSSSRGLLCRKGLGGEASRPAEGS